MNNALYVGLSRQMTLQRALDLAANNLANVDTAGFKLEQPILNDEPALAPRKSGQAGPIEYVLDHGVARDFSQGALEQTGAPYDVGIDGDGFFTVNTPSGPRYTRDGRFTVDTSNRLVDKAGNAVQVAGGGDITLDPQRGAPSIAKDGTISQTDDKGASAQVGRLGVVRFADRAALSKVGDNLLDAGAQPALPAADLQLRQGAIERSNVQPVVEITHLIEITRAYERVTQMMTSNQDLSSQAIDRLGKAA